MIRPKNARRASVIWLGVNQELRILATQESRWPERNFRVSCCKWGRKKSRLQSHKFVTHLEGLRHREATYFVLLPQTRDRWIECSRPHTVHTHSLSIQSPGRPSGSLVRNRGNRLLRDDSRHRLPGQETHGEPE